MENVRKNARHAKIYKKCENNVKYARNVRKCEKCKKM